MGRCLNRPRGPYPWSVASGKADPGLALGIDFGGTGIKGALVDAATGELCTRRVRVSTPQPSTPEAVAASIAHVVELCAEERPIARGIPVGLGLPGVIVGGTVLTAANIDRGWVGQSADELIGAALGRKVYAVNDADCAGLAEMRLGAGRDVPGTVLLLTIGTGIGSALFVDGRLVPNTELGHLEFHGRVAELRLSGVARERRRLRWKAWATEFDEYLARVERLFWPDLIIIGGGVSKAMDKFSEWLTPRAPLVPARFRNTSGIIGAALYAHDRARGAPPLD